MTEQDQELKRVWFTMEKGQEIAYIEGVRYLKKVKKVKKIQDLKEYRKIYMRGYRKRRLAELKNLRKIVNDKASEKKDIEKLNVVT